MREQEWFIDTLGRIFHELGWWSRVFDMGPAIVACIIQPRGHIGGGYIYQVNIIDHPGGGWQVQAQGRGTVGISDRAEVCEQVVHVVTYGEIHGVIDRKESDHAGDGDESLGGDQKRRDGDP